MQSHARYILPCKIYPQVLKNVRVVDKSAARNDLDVAAKVDEITERLGDTGRVLLRESGTEPVLRVMVESESTEICEKYVDEIISVIIDKKYVV